MFKWLNVFTIFKCNWLLDSEHCDDNFFNMGSFVAIEYEKLLIYAFFCVS
jgi:hypothetical protein